MSLYIKIKTVKICSMLFAQSLHTIVACAVLSTDDNIMIIIMNYMAANLQRCINSHMWFGNGCSY